MHVSEVTDPSTWNRGLSLNRQASFLQSWEWGEFQTSVGHRARRFLTGSDPQSPVLVQGLEHTLPLRASFLYIPFSPAGDNCRPLIKFLEQERAYCFVRWEPGTAAGDTWRPSFERLRTTSHRQPGTTWVLDLSRPETELLEAMHPKTRYNIRLAERKGVAVRAEKNSEVFIELAAETAKRAGFKGHRAEYYRKMIELPLARQLVAYYGNEPIASNINIVFNGTCTYLHGASASRGRSVMAPYLLQWRSILEARSLGCRTYDFWGIAPATSENSGAGPVTCFHGFCWRAGHSWTGVTRFKVGFGGRAINYSEPFEVPLKLTAYRLWQTAKAAREFWGHYANHQS